MTLDARDGIDNDVSHELPSFLLFDFVLASGRFRFSRSLPILGCHPPLAELERSPWVGERRGNDTDRVAHRPITIDARMDAQNRESPARCE